MKAIIDLDELDEEIYYLAMAINKGIFSKKDEIEFQHVLKTLKTVRSKCEPIEYPISGGTLVFIKGKWQVMDESEINALFGTCKDCEKK